MLRRIFYFLTLLIIFAACKKSNNPPPVEPPPPPPAQQDTSLSLIGHEFVLGNQETSTPDTFILQFNKIVSVKHIIFSEDWCLPELKWEVDPTGKQVRFFNFRCKGIGGEYPFEYSVEDLDGTKITDTIHFLASEKRYNVSGTIRHYWMTPDSRYVWLSTADPHQLLKMELSSGNIVQAFDLPFEPFRFVYNNYNQHFYLLGNHFSDTNPVKDKILVIHPQDGIKKHIQLTFDQYDHPNSYRIWVYDIAFGDNGLGVILSGVGGNSALRWKVIDSRNADTIYLHPEWVKVKEATGGNIYFDGFERAFRTTDGKKILMPELYNSARFGELNTETEEIIERIPPSEISPGHYNVIALNRYNADIYSGNNYKQYILDQNNQSIGSVSQFDMTGITSADYSYHANERNVIYLKVNENFYMFDYNTGKTKMSCKIAYPIHYIFNTADGKYVVGIADQTLHLFDTNIFYRNAQ